MTKPLAEVARMSDDARAKARAELVRAVRRAAAEGLTQPEIARQINRSQPEVSRLLRFHGTSPLAIKLRKATPLLRRLVAEHGGRKLRIFGSVATGTDTIDSDVDLLFEMVKPMSLLELGQLEAQLSQLLETPVDLVPESSLAPQLRQRILAEAVPL